MLKTPFKIPPILMMFSIVLPSIALAQQVCPAYELGQGSQDLHLLQMRSATRSEKKMCPPHMCPNPNGNAHVRSEPIMEPPKAATRSENDINQNRMAADGGQPKPVGFISGTFIDNMVPGATAAADQAADAVTRPIKSAAEEMTGVMDKTTQEGLTEAKEIDEKNAKIAQCKQSGGNLANIIKTNWDKWEKNSVYPYCNACCKIQTQGGNDYDKDCISAFQTFKENYDCSSAAVQTNIGTAARDFRCFLSKNLVAGDSENQQTSYRKYYKEYCSSYNNRDDCNEAFEPFVSFNQQGQTGNGNLNANCNGMDGHQAEISRNKAADEQTSSGGPQFTKAPGCNSTVPANAPYKSSCSNGPVSHETICNLTCAAGYTGDSVQRQCWAGDFRSVNHGEPTSPECVKQKDEVLEKEASSDKHQKNEPKKKVVDSQKSGKDEIATEPVSVVKQENTMMEGTEELQQSTTEAAIKPSEHQEENQTVEASTNTDTMAAAATSQVKQSDTHDPSSEKPSPTESFSTTKPASSVEPKAQSSIAAKPQEPQEAAADSKPEIISSAPATKSEVVKRNLGQITSAESDPDVGVPKSSSPPLNIIKTQPKPNIPETQSKSSSFQNGLAVSVGVALSLVVV